MFRLMLVYATLLLGALGCASPEGDASLTNSSHSIAPLPLLPAAEETVALGASVVPTDPDTALFAGGCFWCMEPPFEKLPGVMSVTSGFAGGREANPSYDDVSRGRTGHTEVVQIIYDPTQVTYEKLLDVFWRNIDPLSADGQFCDRGTQYRSAIFALDGTQRRLAAASRRAVRARFDDRVVTELNGPAPFYPAEAYHQDFYKKNPDRYYSYRRGCGRDARLRALWGDEAGKGSR